MPEKSKNHPLGKTGKHKVKSDHRTINYSSHISREHLPATPVQYSWSAKKRSRWGAMKNKTLHNCTCAAAGHMIQCWSMHTASQIIIPDKQIVKDYAAVSGYNPKTGENDDGAAALDLLKYWRKNGIGGYKIIAFASVNYHDKELIAQSIFIFGGLFAGMQLPQSIIGQKIWDVLPTGLKGEGKPNSYGGHAVYLPDYDDRGLTSISWGRKYRMTWDFWKAYAEEAYVVLSDNFLKNKKTPTGLNLLSLEKELMNVTGEKVRLSPELTGKKPVKIYGKKKSPGQSGDRTE